MKRKDLNRGMFTRRGLAIRWNCSLAKIDRIPDCELPRIDISGGGKRPTWRFMPKNVIAYENRYMHDGTDSEELMALEGI